MSTKKILVIEDEKPLRLALKDKLTKAGYDVVEAQDGVQGLELALSEHPDMLLLDLIMPKMDGHTMLAELRKDEWGKFVPVIILTNSNDNTAILGTLQLSAQDFLIKAETSLSDIVEDVKSRIGAPQLD